MVVCMAERLLRLRLLLRYAVLVWVERDGWDLYCLSAVKDGAA
jgi:hypothetical protein